MKVHILVGFCLVAIVSGNIVEPLGLTCNSLGIEEVCLSNILKSGDIGTSVIDGWCKLNQDMELFVENDEGREICLNPIEDDESECLEDTERDLCNRVRFHVHTRKNIETPIELLLEDEVSWNNCNIDLTRPTKLVVHGWQNSCRSKSSVIIKDALLKNDDCNVILVDWSSIACRPYGWVSQRVPMIGQHVSKLINWMIARGLDVKKLGGVGHCVGAHILGTASRKASKKLNYLVALDAAQQNFLLSPHRVCRDDADYVEAIHTNSGVLGLPISIGHADFRPNGGCLQNGCVGGSCAHARSCELYAESLVTKKGFHGKKCNSYLDYKSGKCESIIGLMGGAVAKPDVIGDFYLQTNHEAPYCI